MPKVLIIEDDATSAHLLKTILSKLDCESTVESKIESAWDTTRREIIFDFCLLDVHLTDGDARDFLKPLRRHPILKKLPVIICSQNSEKAMVLDLVQLGIQDYQLKPYNREKIDSAVKKILDTGPWYQSLSGDLQETGERLGSSQEEVLEHLKICQKSFEQAHLNLEAGFKGGNLKSLLQEIDKIRGSSLNLGLTGYKQIAEAIQAAVEARKLSNAKDYTTFFRRMLDLMPVDSGIEGPSES